MTMLDHKCEVCFVNEPIGVAGTVLPYSCAYCVECLRNDAQPLVVFETLYDDFGTRFDEMLEGMADELVTFADGGYQSYREWATNKKASEK